MGQRVARLSDPISHGGTIIEASTNVLTNGRGTARLGDAVFCLMHGSQVIATASQTVITNGRGTARVGDSISCGAVIVDGSPNVLSG